MLVAEIIDILLASSILPEAKLQHHCFAKTVESTHTPFVRVHEDFAPVPGEQTRELVDGALSSETERLSNVEGGKKVLEEVHLVVLQWWSEVTGSSENGTISRRESVFNLDDDDSDEEIELGVAVMVRGPPVSVLR